jgi:hypothetical protein
MRVALVLVVAGCGAPPRPLVVPWDPPPRQEEVPVVLDASVRVTLEGEDAVQLDDEIIEGTLGPPPSSHAEGATLMRDAVTCRRDLDRTFGHFWIEVTIDPAGRPIHVAQGGFGDAAACVTKVARNRHYRELRGTVRVSY